MQPTYVSLFAGAGGFDIGFDRAGFACLAQVEIDPTARAVLARHWPNVPRYEDVRHFGAAQVSHADVVVGGFPCQDLSVAGKRGGITGERSGLFYELVRVAVELRCRFLVWENVPGLFSSFTRADDPPDLVEGREWEVDETSDFEAVLSHLAGCGFHGGWRCLDARRFGVPQSRNRVFGCFTRDRASAHCCAEILALADGVRRNPAPGREEGAGVAAGAQGGTGGDGRIAPSLRASGVGTERIGDTGGQDCVVLAPCLRSNPHNNSDPSQEAKMLVFGQTGDFADYRQAEATGPLRADGDGESGAANLAVYGGNACGERGGDAALLGKAGSRGDFETENLVAFQCHGSNVGPVGTLRQGNGAVTGGVPFVFNAKQGGEGSDDVSPTLLAMPHDRSHANAGGQLAVFTVHGEHSTAMTGNGSAAVAFPTELARSLDTTGGYATNQGGTVVLGAATACLAPDATPKGRDDNLAYALTSRKDRGHGHGMAVCVTGEEVTHALTAEGHDASEDGTGCGTPIVSVAQNQRGEVRTSPSSAAAAGDGGKPGEGYPAAMDGNRLVRRLTPRESERLMGWPDDWTRYRADGSEIADGPRYRLCGNGVVGTVATWLAMRVRDALLQERRAA